jgi:ubiquinol-cytochrome c reductase cytochrome c subunit
MPLVPPGRSDTAGRARAPLPGAQPPDPDRVVQRHAPAYDEETVADLVDYVGRLAADGGPPIPGVVVGNDAEGGKLYRESCAACHSWSGDGGALYARAAPPLHAATRRQIAEAIRVGPGHMPAFGSAALTDDQVADVVAYVRTLDHPEDRGGFGLSHVGPVAEGAVAFGALAVLLAASRWIGDRRHGR